MAQIKINVVKVTEEEMEITIPFYAKINENYTVGILEDGTIETIYENTGLISFNKETEKSEEEIIKKLNRFAGYDKKLRTSDIKIISEMDYKLERSVFLNNLLNEFLTEKIDITNGE